MNTTQMELVEGVYDIPPTLRAYVKARKLYVVPRFVRPHVDRCRDCKHMGEGFSRNYQRYKRNVCLLRPKKDNLFYNTLESRQACDKFEKKYSS